MLLSDSADNARKAKNDSLAEQLFQKALQGFQLILADKPDAWESRLDHGWVLLKLGDMSKKSGDFAKAAEYYQQVMASTDLLHEQLRDQSSASELNFNAGYALFHVTTQMNKFDDARRLAENQSSKYTENQGFFSVLACQCLIRAGKHEEAIEKLKVIETATSMHPTMLFEIGRAHNLIATQATDRQQVTAHISSTLDWMEKAFEAGFNQTWVFDSDDYFPLLAAEPKFQGLKVRFGKR